MDLGPCCRTCVAADKAVIVCSLRSRLLEALQLNLGVDMTGLVSRLLSALLQTMVIVIRRGPEAASTVDPADIRRLPTRIGSATRSGFVVS